MWSDIWNIPYVELRILKSSMLWSSQLWTQFKQLRIEAWKSQNFKGVWTRDLATPVRRWLERRTGIARSRVQTPLKSWLFQASIRNCLNCVHNCDDHSLLELLIYILTLVPFHFHLSKGSVVLLPNYESFSTSKTVSSKWKSLLNYQKHIFYKKLN